MRNVARRGIGYYRKRASYLKPHHARATSATSSCVQQPQVTATVRPWRVLVVDDDSEVHAATRLALLDFSFEGRPLELLEAGSGEEARQLWLRERDIALVLLDVVMETDHAGLDFVRFLRDAQGDERVRIVLRTGHPGEIPAQNIIQQYQIDDYRTKTELTFQRLTLVISTALRTYRLLQERDERQQVLEASNRDLERLNRELGRLNRTYAVLSDINALILRARSQQMVFEGACRIAVEQGHFRMAWVGMVRGDALEPVAVHGADSGYVELVNIKLTGLDPTVRGPAATAIRERRPSVCHNIANDPSFAPWRNAALQRGYHSCIALPLMSGSGTIGCLCLYAAESGFFDDGEIKLLLELAGDIAYALEFIAREQRLDYLANFDPLTGLANRRLFSDQLDKFLREPRRQGRTIGLVMLDLMNFKSVNDSLGMVAGDELLRKIARRLQRYFARPGLVARVGGDRFAALLSDLHTTSIRDPYLYERLWDGLTRPYRIQAQQVRISVRIGIAMFPHDGSDSEALIQHAEAALKKAKASNDDILFYTQQMSADLNTRLRLEGQLRRALEQSEFELHYQPKVDLRDGAICGAEALLRWNSPEIGMVGPADFVALLEETGLIVKIGRWVLRQAALDMQAWRAAGVRVPRIAVNVSPLQLRQAGFADEIRSVICDRYADFGLEVTESALLSDKEQQAAKLRQLRALGVTVAIDDFGVGYSSLSRLSRLPVDALKIDRSFIVGMTDNGDAMNIVATIIALAHSMNLRVIAEGVESEEQLKFLRFLHCDEIQGFLFSAALPADEFAQLLKDGRRLTSPSRTQ